MNMQEQFFELIGKKIEITPKVVLDIIALLNKHASSGLGTCILVGGDCFGDIVEDVLYSCLRFSKDDEVKQAIIDMFKD